MSAGRALRRCQCCGKQFWARQADVARGWARTCSKSCAAKVRPRPAKRRSRHYTAYDAEDSYEFSTDREYRLDSEYFNAFGVERP